MGKHLFFVLCTLCVTYATGAPAQTAGYVAGVHPHQRPDGAPRLTEDVRTPEQLKRELHGVEKPVPGNVESIAATGNWWVPLRQPGMTKPYDPRGWHGTGAHPSGVPPAAAPSGR